MNFSSSIHSQLFVVLLLLLLLWTILSECLSMCVKETAPIPPKSNTNYSLPCFVSSLVRWISLWIFHFLTQKNSQKLIVIKIIHERNLFTQPERTRNPLLSYTPPSHPTLPVILVPPKIQSTRIEWMEFTWTYTANTKAAKITLSSNTLIAPQQPPQCGLHSTLLYHTILL